MRLQAKSLSRVSLQDLLRRKRTTLDAFLKGNGITTYPLLKLRCDSMGVTAPSEQEFNEVRGNLGVPDCSSPTEGVVVVYTTVSVSQETQEINVDAPDASAAEEPHTNDSLPSPPKKRKKRSEKVDAAK